MGIAMSGKLHQRPARYAQTTNDADRVEVGSLDGLIKAKSMAQRPLKPDISKIARRHCAQAPVFLEPI
jgi:hypothetical protein